MSNLHIFQNCARRFLTIEIPTEVQKIRVAPTPFERYGKPILLGRRSEGFLIALIPNHLDNIRQEQISAPLSNGFELALRDLNDEESGETSQYLEFRNVGNIDVTLFGALLDEILVNIDGVSGNLIDEIKQIIEKWKYMLSLKSQRKLELQAIIGLIGELLFLEYLIEIRGGEALMSWVGPLGNRHDFEFDSKSIEVKTTTSKTGHELTIHGLTQLEPYPGKTVSILKIKLEPDPTGLSLPALIDRILNSNLISNAKFAEKLQQVGYNSEDRDSYIDLAFRALLFQIIPVDKNFPRITKSFLQEFDKKERILDIQYVVNVAGLENQSEPEIRNLSLEGLL